MTAERKAMESAADAIAKIAETDLTLLTGGDPLKVVVPALQGLENKLLVQVAHLLLLRFHGTAQDRVAHLLPLLAVSKDVVVPALLKLQKCIGEHRALQSACSLTPVLHRAIALGAQCCSLAVRNLADQSALQPIARCMKALSDVLVDSVVTRVECIRPLDAAQVSLLHHTFAACQSQMGQALSAMEESWLSVTHPLAPAPQERAHAWRNDELRQFWEAKCVPRFDGPAPLDALAILILRAADVESPLVNREAVMRRLAALERRDPGRISGPELDRCSAEVRRSGGFRAWVHALLLPGGAEVPRIGPLAAHRLASTSQSSASSACATGQCHSDLDSTTVGGSSMWPLTHRTTRNPSFTATALSASGQSVRTTGTAFTPRGDRRKPFILSQSLPRKINTHEGDGGGPLFDSVERNLLKTSQRLAFGDKVPVEERHCTFHETPLHAAAVQDRARHAPLTSLLLDRGANVHAEDKNLATPLHMAASSGHGHVAKKLVKSGADVRKEDRWYSTPLHKAADNGHAEVAELLLKSGASAGVADQWGATPLHRAAIRGQLAVAEMILGNGNADVNAEDKAGNLPIHLAAQQGDYAMVRLLLEHGSSATARARLSGKSVEECARERNHINVVTLLHHRDEWITTHSKAMMVVA